MRTRTSSFAAFLALALLVSGCSGSPLAPDKVLGGSVPATPAQIVSFSIMGAKDLGGGLFEAAMGTNPRVDLKVTNPKTPGRKIQFVIQSEPSQVVSRFERTLVEAEVQEPMFWMQLGFWVEAYWADKGPARFTVRIEETDEPPIERVLEVRAVR